MSDLNNNILSEEEMNYGYEKAEMDLLRDGIRRNYKERFLMMTTLMKAGNMMSKAKIVHKSFSGKSS